MIDTPLALSAFAVTPFYLFLCAIEVGIMIVGFAYLVLRHGRVRQYAGAPTDVTFGNIDGREELVPFFRGDPIPVEYVPPDNLRPGQLGTLVDQVANPQDVTATIVDLAVRGYLTITETPEHANGNADWTLTKKRDGAGLKAYEHLVLDALFADGDAVQVSVLRRNFDTHVKVFDAVQGALYHDAVELGWFSRRPDATRGLWMGFGVSCTFLGLGGIYLVIAEKGDAGLLLLPLVVGGIVFAFLSKWIPCRTAKGTAVMRRALGFRRFIVESEKSRAQFAERQNLFTEYLPYAIAFGATGKWATAFAGLAYDPGDQWAYLGFSPRNLAALRNAVFGFGG